ncbi:MAG: hypothetical protein KC583_08530, partial [Myxococcales bacterium]|nr:hypothetical protein [Myxococcales bacterium]
MVVPAAAWAQQEADEVVPIPFSQRNPALPHPAHEGAQITLKGVVRNATCNAGYDVTWDVNNDGVYNDYTFTASRDGTTGWVEDIGRTFVVPNVDRDSRFNINV